MVKMKEAMLSFLIAFIVYWLLSRYATYFVGFWLDNKISKSIVAIAFYFLLRNKKNPMILIVILYVIYLLEFIMFIGRVALL